jgi:hypothetical protein
LVREQPEVTGGQTATTYTPVTGRALKVAIAAGFAGLAMWLFIPVEGVLDSVRLQKGQRDAEVIANKFLQDRMVNPVEWRRVTTFQSQFDGQAAEYVRRNSGIKRIN